MNSPYPTILLVEDDPNDVFLMQRAFRKAGLPHPLILARDGEQAIDYLASEDPSLPVPGLVLLDLKLPKKSGHEVLRWIRAHPAFRRIPVVVMTSSAGDGDVEQAYDEGANSYLVKPCGFEALLEMVRALATFWLTHNTPAPAPSAIQSY